MGKLRPMTRAFKFETAEKATQARRSISRSGNLLGLTIVQEADTLRLEGANHEVNLAADVALQYGGKLLEPSPSIN